jgi:hypothetical protein
MGGGASWQGLENDGKCRLLLVISQVVFLIHAN